ncbi:hypothetical protein JAAARDRAFT_129999 [Jaapia argillacea MUCL 33604]|uniref:Ribosome biogenesis protein YTM1 n=1 Tax=Jaapia argillacea MUCL 33604 TaxID=933084 RepID=A0A067PRX9_9AGAM|nr:hypothetical protein JAAARDRAFT_129999 [Jaapia argillacea MUCL 33604]
MASTSEAARPVVFTTSTPYPLPSQKFMIPTTWKRYQLSQLINKALDLPKPIPFDFLIRGELLRGSLGEWCAERDVGDEETLNIEYIESVMPPQKMSSLPHQDWVSSVSCKIPEHFITGSYDGSIRLFSYSQQLLQTSHLHEAPITSLSIIPQTTSSTDDTTSYLVATASHDLTGLITRLFLSPESKPKTESLASLHLHTSPLASISANSSGTHLLTSSWDSLIGLWDTSIPPSDEIPLEADTTRSSKKRKLAKSGERPKRKAPLQVLKSHTGRVSKVIFGRGEERDEGNGYSCGYDSTVRVWDVESGMCTRTVSASEKPFLDLALMSSQTVLAASTDRTITSYDLRAPTSSILTSSSSMIHPSVPSCITTPSSSPSINNHQFVSGAYDGVVRLWDLRSVKSPISGFKVNEGGKVLCVDWVVGGGGGGKGMVGIGGEGGVEVWQVGMDVSR